MKRKILSGLLLLGILALVSLPSDKVYAEEEYVLIDDESDEICSMELEEEVQLPNDNDVLFEEYAAREFGLDEYDIEVQFSNQCRDNLNEYEKNVYDVILSAAEDIANGNRSSAIIEITYADIFGEGKLTYTADELEGYTGDNLRTKLGYRLISEANSGTVIKALLNDCPYEFYWFDKLVGSVGNTLTLSASISADGTKVTVNKDAVLFTFKYAVEESYASDLYIADTEKTSLVRTAVSNAKGIVAAAASKGDYDKLMYYADEICDMVYYDTSAVEGSSAGTQTDCDPWQLIYVFDGDNSTNVVCEGYAKAFQYLCDQSSFEGNTYSYIITGYAGNADRVSKARAYAHMWNFVHMDDERVYYMDVTWADGGAGIDSLIQEADVSTDTYFEMDIQGTMKKYIFSDDTIRTYTSNQLKLSLVAYGEEAPATPTPTAVPTPTVTPSATATPTPTATVKPSVTPMPTATPTVAPTVAPVVTPTPTVTPATGSTMKQVNGTWYYYVNGVNDTSYTGMVQYNGEWYYIQRGVLKWGYTGMVQYNGIWYYIQNSTLRLDYTGMVQYNGTWYYIQNSTLKWGYTGMVQYNGTWYYVQNSTLKWGYTGMVQYNGTWYYIQNSTLKWGYTGLVMYGNKWYYIQNSTLKWGVTTLVQYDKDKYWYYVNNSCVDFSYTGYFTYGGTRYRVVNGRVQ